MIVDRREVRVIRRLSPRVPARPSRKRLFRRRPLARAESDDGRLVEIWDTASIFRIKFLRELGPAPRMRCARPPARSRYGAPEDIRGVRSTRSRARSLRCDAASALPNDSWLFDEEAERAGRCGGLQVFEADKFDGVIVAIALLNDVARDDRAADGGTPLRP